jgi:ribose transport system substrate-binding protein
MTSNVLRLAAGLLLAGVISTTGCDQGTTTPTAPPAAPASNPAPATAAVANPVTTPGAAAPGVASAAPAPAAADADAGGAKPRVAYITNGVDPFWVIAEKGAQDAAKKFNVDVQVIMPDGANDQKQKVEDLLTRGIDGIAISPIDAKNQTPMLNEVAKKTRLITHDSDAPDSNRLIYIGMDNYKAGRMCGELVKAAVPNGGKVAIFVGRLEQDNARLRRQGVIDELLDREPDNTRFDAPDAEIKGNKYTIVGTRTDDFDRAKAKSNTEDMISLHPDLACAVGLFAYNPPACLEGIKRQNKVGKVMLVAFDEQDATLQAIKDGACYGTVVQNPYMYGHESVRVLAGLHRGVTRGMPSGKFMDVSARKVTKENVDSFWADLRDKTAK